MFQIPIEEVLTVDGYFKMVYAVNGTVPGPPIVVYEQQTLIIHVNNQLLSDSISIHWHGLDQKGTPFMDGVGYITQCPIGFGQKFTYKFKVEIQLTINTTLSPGDLCLFDVAISHRKKTKRPGDEVAINKLYR